MNTDAVEISLMVIWGPPLLLAIVALAVPWVSALIQWLRRPKLEIRLGKGPPFKHVMPTRVAQGEPADGLWVRVGIRNVGRSGAGAVELVALRMKKKGKQKDGQARFMTLPTWVPQNLVWAYAPLPGTLGEPWLRHIPPGVEKYCNVVRVLDPAKMEPRLTHTVMDLTVAVQSSAGEFRRDPGTYRIELLAGAANAKPSRVRTLEIALRKDWNRDEPAKTVAVRLLP